MLRRRWRRCRDYDTTPYGKRLVFDLRARVASLVQFSALTLQIVGALPITGATIASTETIVSTDKRTA
jgi:hypothetical protein